MKIIFFILFPLFSFSQQKLFFSLNQDGAFVLQKPICSFSVRLLDTAYHGYCMKVRRSSDSTEQDIGFVSGNLDTASLKTFVGSGSGYVSIWYDQSFGNNATQATLSRQPEIVNTGVVDRENAKPALVLNGTSTYLTVANNPLTGLSSVSFLGVANFSTATSAEELFAQSNGLSNTGVFEVRRSGTGNALACVSNNVSAATGTQAINAQKLIAVYGSNNGTLYTYINNVKNFGVKATGTGTSATIGNYPCLIGYRNSTLYFGGTIQEIVVYKENNLLGRSSLESAINSYYSIY